MVINPMVYFNTFVACLRLQRYISDFKYLSSVKYPKKNQKNKKSNLKKFFK